MLSTDGITIIKSNLSLVISFCFFIIGWLITCISAIVSAAKYSSNTWLGWITFNCIASGFIVYYIINTNNIKGYRFALMTYLGLSINWSIDLVHGNLHTNEATANAIGVGQLLISVAYFIWILYFGCDPDTAVGNITCSNIVKKSVPNVNSGNNNYSLQNVTTDSAYQNEQSNNTSPKPTNLRAEALFDYTANKEDPNEISFSQGEIMDILDNNGRWWQARKADGTMGIVPSNFFKLV